MTIQLNSGSSPSFACASVQDHNGTVDVGGGMRTSPEVAAMLGLGGSSGGNSWDAMGAADGDAPRRTLSNATVFESKSIYDADHLPTEKYNSGGAISKGYAAHDMAGVQLDSPSSFNALTEFHLSDGADAEYGYKAAQALAKDTGVSMEVAAARLEASMEATQNQLDTLYGSIVDSAPMGAREQFMKNNESAIRQAYQEITKHGTTSQADKLMQRFKSQYGL